MYKCGNQATLLSSVLRQRLSTSAVNVPSVHTLLDKIRARDNLALGDPHIEHLVLGNSGSSSSDQKELVDFSDKTRLILQSSHPIRHVVEREIINLQNQHKFVSYHNWVTIFGRCLNVNITTTKERNLFDINLSHIANAAEAGMLSSKVHEVVLDIPPPLETNLDSWEQFYMGNKYAVLVGDYFAVKTVFYAQRTKVNKVFLCITRGIEDFASVSFFSNLTRKDVWYPILAAPGTAPSDWAHYAEKVSGYFTGGLQAVLTISKNDLHSGPEFVKVMQEFCRSFCKVLKLADELDHINTTPGAQICVTLPAILHQQQNPGCFDKIKEKSLLLTDDDFKRVQKELLEDREAIEHARNLVLKYGSDTKELIERIGMDSFYVPVFQQLIDATISDVIR